MPYDINNLDKFDEKFVCDTDSEEHPFVGFYNEGDNKFEFWNAYKIKSFILQDRQEAYNIGRQSGLEEVENVINNEIIIHKQLESECVGSIEDIKMGRKGENPHTFVIEQLQVLKSRMINKLKQ